MSTQSPELSAYLLRLAEVPRHLHPTKHVDGLGEVG